jgi:uncharacterized ferritin-like protein (DUF455 family)
MLSTDFKRNSKYPQYDAVFSLQDRKALLVRMVSLADEVIKDLAYRLPRISCLNTKIAYGINMGLLADTAVKIRERLSEMGERSIETTQSVKSDPENDFCLDRKISSLKDTVDAYLDKCRGIEDQPTKLILMHAKSSLEMQREAIDMFVSNEYIFAGEQELPQRPAGFKIADFPHVDNKSIVETVKDRDSFKKFMHFLIMDIEVGIMEVCSRHIETYPEMETDFMYDMARQTWDEARHASFLLARYHDLGGEIGDYPVSHIAYKADMKGDSLLEKLTIQQIIGEGNGIDAAQITIKTCYEEGDSLTAELFTFQNTDEVGHCKIGNKWVLKMLGNDVEAYERLINDVSAKIRRSVPGSAPVDYRSREKAGFPIEFLNHIKSSVTLG